MRLRTEKSGFSLTELIVVMSIIGVLAGIGLPAVKQVIKSFESSDRVKDVVAAAFSNARARALANKKEPGYTGYTGYTGIRFQCDLEGNQYMVFIESDDNNPNGWADGFRPVIGRNPIRLPKGGLVMDMHLRAAVADATDPAYVDLNTDAQIDTPQELRDASTFCVIFSKAGKLVLQDVRIWEGAGDVFNKNYDWEVDPKPIGYIEPLLFIDDYPNQGLGEESSRNNFVIVDKKKFNAAAADERYSRYLQNLKPIYINPYTGELISN